MNSIGRWIAVLLSWCWLSPAWGMVELRDDQLAQVTGQALFMMDSQPGIGVSSGLDFYKVGLDAALEINMNIQKLQLGCGGVNGPGCDIDIDNLSLSGNCDTNRVACSALLTRPFVEFAIKNDDMPALREVVGFRLSAEMATGLLTAGYQDPSMSPEDSMNGINSLSGYMKIGSATGVASTAPRPMSYSNTTYNGQTYNGLGTQMTGNLWLTVLGIINDVVEISSNDYNLILQSTNAYVTTDPTEVYGNRMTSVNLTGSATIDPISFSGPMRAYVSNLLGLGINLNLDKEVTGSLTGLTATVPIEQSLAFIHKISVNNPFSLSMQGESVLWPGATVAAETGWWMAFEDEIDIGSISPEAQVALTNDVLLQALGPEWASAGSGTTCTVASVNCALFRGLGVRNGEPYGIRCNGLDDCLGGSLNVGTVNVPKQLNFPLENLKLGAQAVVPNCWGSSRFC